MARPALRKIDPSLDLSRHLRTLQQLPVPWDDQRTVLRGRHRWKSKWAAAKACLWSRLRGSGRSTISWGAKSPGTTRVWRRPAWREPAEPMRSCSKGTALQLFREVLPDGLCGRGPRLFPRSLVEAKASKTPRDEAGISRRRRTGFGAGRPACISGPTSRSISTPPWP